MHTNINTLARHTQCIQSFLLLTFKRGLNSLEKLVYWTHPVDWDHRVTKGQSPDL